MLWIAWGCVEERWREMLEGCRPEENKRKKEKKRRRKPEIRMKMRNANEEPESEGKKNRRISRGGKNKIKRRIKKE